MNNFTLHLGDCLDVLHSYPDNSIDAIVTDPPYGLSFMGKKWDYDVPSVEIWKECLRVLKPGGHLLSFSSARTYHRMVVNVEDAGFEIRDQLMWVYGSGFPKSHNVAIAIDKQLAGMKHRGKRTNYGTTMITSETQHLTSSGDLIERDKAMPKHEPMCDESRQWEGWGTALKPAHEPIVMARKPISEKTIAENVLKWGTGAINIDRSRVPASDKATFPKGDYTTDTPVGSIRPTLRTSDANPDGRFPANFIHDGIDAEWSRYFYCAKASKSDRGAGNNHPTVKPIKLMTYLVGLVTPPNGVVLDPFMGSGSTGVAAIASAFDFVGIEMDEHYLNIAQHRINHHR